MRCRVNRDPDKLWRGPPGPRGSPWTRSPLSIRKVSFNLKWPTRASAADQGVRPTCAIVFAMRQIALLCFPAIFCFAQTHPVTDAEVQRIHKSALLIDTHNDITSRDRKSTRLNSSH